MEVMEKMPGAGDANTQDERDLVRRCVRGDPRAQEQLVRLYQGTVERHVAQLLHQYNCSRLVATHLDEIVQEIWAELFKRLPDSSPRDFGPWFAFLRRWRTVDYLRKELKYRDRHAVTDDISATPGTEPARKTASQEETLHRAEMRREIKICLKKLPPRQREFVWLYYFKDYSYNEICRAHGNRRETRRNPAHAGPAEPGEAPGSEGTSSFQGVVLLFPSSFGLGPIGRGET